MAEILKINTVSKRYSNHQALLNVSLSIEEKSVFGLLGPNGAGKTSLIRIINQITGPDTGEVLFRGQKIGAEHVSRIGYLPEERGLYKKMKVGEQVLYLARLKGLSRAEARKRIEYWFEKFEMGGWWKKKVEELSKGMQQKVQFIVTVIHEPELLILDEPFSGFDPINAQLIRNELLDLRKKGATIVLSTHNMGSVEELCDSIALLNKSEKILDGTVKDIKRAYHNNKYRIAFKGNAIGFTHALWTGAEILSKEVEDGVNTYVLKASGSVTGNQILQAAINNCEVIAFNEVLPSMDEIFISKVKGVVDTGEASVSFTE